jgi:hypothetical protein
MSDVGIEASRDPGRWDERQHSDRRSRARARRDGSTHSDHVAPRELVPPFGAEQQRGGAGHANGLGRDRDAPSAAVSSTAATLLLVCLHPARIWLTVELTGPSAARQSAASPGQTGSRCPGSRRDSWRSGPAVSDGPTRSNETAASPIQQRDEDPPRGCSFVCSRAGSYVGARALGGRARI